MRAEHARVRSDRRLVSQPIAAGPEASRKHSRSPLRCQSPSRILDVGCGNGVPVTEALVNAGYRVVGLDSSAGMLARFQANLPGTSVVRGDARRCPFVNGASMRQFRWG